MARLLSPTQVEQVHLMRDVVDDWGDPVHSGAAIAATFGVSEATIWRVLKKRTAYGQGLKKARVDETTARLLDTDGLRLGQAERPDLEAAAEASQKRLLATLERQEATRELVSQEARERAKMLGAFEAPLSPLDE